MITIGRDTLITIGRDTLITIGRDTLITIGRDTLITIGRDTLITIGRDTLITIEKPTILHSVRDDGSYLVYGEKCKIGCLENQVRLVFELTTTGYSIYKKI